MLTYDMRMHLPVQCTWSLGLRLLCTSTLFSPELRDVDSSDTIIHCAYVGIIVGTVWNYCAYVGITGRYVPYGIKHHNVDKGTFG